MNWRGVSLVLSFFCSLAFSTLCAQTAAVSPAVEQLYEEARSAQSRGEMDTAIAKYEEIRRAAPGLAAACNNLGSLYYDVGQFQKAIAVLQSGLRIDPKMAASYAILGMAYNAQADYAHAIVALKSAVKLNRQDQRSEDLLEQSLIALRKYDEAVDRLKSRVQSYPDDQNAWYRLGNLYLLLSQQAHAKTIAIAPDSSITYELEGEIQEGMANLRSAQSKYEQAVKLDPDKPGTHEHLGNILWVQAQWPEAQREFEAELVNDGGNCRARWKLANCMLNRGANPEDALKELNAAVVRCPDLMQARVERARTLALLQRAAEGLDDLLLAVKENPEEPSIHFLLAKIYRAKGQAAAAAEEMRLFTAYSDKGKHIPDTDATQNEAAQHQ